MDRISLLPDSLLHDIFCSLDTKQVVQTCVLSKRWKTFWTHIPTLNFDFDSYSFAATTTCIDDMKNNGGQWLSVPTLNFDFDSNPFAATTTSIDDMKNNGGVPILNFENTFYCLTWKEKSFRRFILRVLSKHCSEYIKKISYSSPRSDEVLFVKKILSFAPCLIAKELYLTTYNFAYCSLSSCLPACKLLTVLRITCRDVSNLESLVLPSLRILEIKRVLEYWDMKNYFEEGEEEYYDGYYLTIPLNEKSFSGCPNLESLVLFDCLFLYTLIISAPKLENLEVSASGFVLTYPDVKLWAPNLKSVKFRNVIPFVKPASDFLNLHRVSIAISSFDFVGEDLLSDPMQRYSISELLKVFNNVVSLTLPPNATEVIFKSPDLSGCCFHNLRHLMEFKTRLTEKMIDVPVGPNTIAHFIDCPNLQTLSQLDLEDKVSVLNSAV